MAATIRADQIDPAVQLAVGPPDVVACGCSQKETCLFLLEYIIFAVGTFSWYSDPETYIEKQVFFATEVLELDKARKPSNLDENRQ